jgi:hypothetical protein
MSIFQNSVIRGVKSRIYASENMSYDNTYFYCPRVWAKDGFSISLQVHSTNYCASEKGYRKLGHTMKSVEFGFPSEHDELLVPYAEDFENITETVGNIPVSVLEELFEKHGGIDWEKTISIEHFEEFTEE